jgi:lipopolysaccharide/colanic/teichoic acid biosynthesis glycosyltransferase
MTQKRLLDQHEKASPAAGDHAGQLDWLCKRALDLTLSSLALLILSPLLLLIAVLIKADSRGPIFFVHRRVGARRRVREGRVEWERCEFPMYKFRSMYHNADQSLHQAHVQALAQGQVGSAEHESATLKLVGDPRITRVGRLLRRASLDELPQLVNVWRGDMSLVGPRPLPPYEVAEFKPWHYERFGALPGISGFWQVYGRCQVSFDEMIQMDVDYVRQRSIWLDLKLLLLTFPAILSGRGAG